MNPILSVHTWVSLPNEVRYRIRSLFGIPRSSNTVVNDGRIETDGTTMEDFKHLTTEKMQKYLGDASDDFYRLFDKVVARVTDELQGKQTVVVSSDEPVTVVIEPKKKGRPKKNLND